MNEVIIDGCNVAECIYYNPDKLANCGMFALGDFKCEGQICLYKQLQRAKAENETLKAELRLLKNTVPFNIEDYIKDNPELQAEIEKLST